VAIYMVAISPMLQGCAARSTPTPDHFDGSRFHNRASGLDYSLWQEVKIGWELRTKKKNWPARFETTSYRAPTDPVLHGFRVLWIGRSTALIQTPRLNIITDPILDHLDLRSLHALVDRQRTARPTILVGRGVGQLLKNVGLSSYAELDWDESVTVKDAQVHFLEAIHTSRRGAWDTDKTLWGSFGKYGAPRVSLRPVGAYEPRWFMDRMHMNPDEAVNDLAAARRAHGVEATNFVAPHYGQVFRY
jgi:hypothetical protein